ncbi:MAG: ATP synthase F1 subunit gamma [Saprospiraceae bacterium]|nr:ATP synthase F1 subunit gamma [Saprospiraceae bacterium]
MSGKLKEVRERIRSVKTTQQTTKAMKMVSAAKLRKAQDAIVKLRPYADGLQRMLMNIMSNLGSDTGTSYGEFREVKRVLLVPITSNRGLAGAFNTNVNKALVERLEEDFMPHYEDGRLDILPIGKKGRDYFKKRYPKANFIEDHVMLFDDLHFPQVSEVAQRIMDAFTAGQYDHVEMAYAKFKNAATQYFSSEQFLPVAKSEVKEDNKDKGTKAFRADYIFEPEKEALLEELIPSILHTQFFKYCLDTHASEHGARMTAMDKATENAEEILKDLRINYNKARQEAITGEILEIVGGAAALEG